MVMNTCSRSQANRQRKSELKLIPPSFPPLGDGDQDRIGALEAQIVT
jgi:hypothetical protein